MQAFVAEKKIAFETVVGHLKDALSALRTGRASPALVEHIPVVAYGSTMEVKALASIGVPDAKTIVIDPWDKSLLPALEKAIREADMGVNPAIDGTLVRLNLPSMTEENRKKLVKAMRERLEEARIALRAVREEVRSEIMKREKDKKIGEDDKFKMLDDLDKLTKEFTAAVDQIGEKKEQEIMTI